MHTQEFLFSKIPFPPFLDGNISSAQEGEGSTESGRGSKEWKRFMCQDSRGFVSSAAAARGRKRVIRRRPLSWAKRWYVWNPWFARLVFSVNFWFSYQFFACEETERWFFCAFVRFVIGVLWIRILLFAYNCSRLLLSIETGFHGLDSNGCCLYHGQILSSNGCNLILLLSHFSSPVVPSRHLFLPLLFFCEPLLRLFLTDELSTWAYYWPIWF